MEPYKLVSYKSYKCERIIDACSCTLGFLKTAFESMSETEPKVNLVFWDGLKAIYDNMEGQLCDAHDLTVEIRSITGDIGHEEFKQIGRDRYREELEEEIRIREAVKSTIDTVE